MKKNRFLALIIAVVITAVGFIIPKGTYAEANTAAAAEAEPTVASDTDFEYILAPKGNPKYVLITKYIGKGSKIIIPDKIKGYPVNVLSNNVFAGCSALTYIEVPATVKTLSGETFAECRNLMDIHIDAKNETYVSDNGIVFNSDKSTLVAFPNGRSGWYTIPETVLTIGSSAFAGAYKITDINMYNSVSSISANAFRGCFSLKNLRLSDCLAVIGEKAFANCVDLRELHIPGSVSIIGADAFLGDMGSKNDKFYYFTDGIYCAPDSAALDYVTKLGISSPYLKTEARSITDVRSGITLIDTDGALPKNEVVQLNVVPVAAEDINLALPIRYDKLLAYDISLTYNEEDFTPAKPVIFNFNHMPSGIVTSAAKVYRISGENAYELIRSPHTPFVAAQSKNPGTYVVATNSDFSKKGDIDGNNVITSYDARFALCLAAGLVNNATMVPEQFTTADVDNNGAISTEDATLILRYAAGITDSFSEG
ncbi:MAG: leucine-rich repeat protein [Clostridia bacterium]|nr:leucine-rich repeat protein [Clostridia bacterium]